MPTATSCCGVSRAGLCPSAEEGATAERDRRVGAPAAEARAERDSGQEDTRQDEHKGGWHVLPAGWTHHDHGWWWWWWIGSSSSIATNGLEM